MTDRTTRRLGVAPRLLIACVLVVGIAALNGQRPADAGDPVSDARRDLVRADGQLADARDGLHAAQRAVGESQTRASEIALRIGAAQARQAELLADIAALELELDATQAEVDVLRPIVEARAVAAYKGTDEHMLDLFDTPDVVDAARRLTLLGRAKEHEDGLIDELNRLEDQLRADQIALEADGAELAEVLSALEQDQQRIIEELTAAQAELSNAQAVVALSEAARTEANAALALAEEEVRRLEAERIAATSTTTTTAPVADDSTETTTSTTSAPDEDAASSPDEDADGGDEPEDSGASVEIICPVDGPVAFADTWGAPRPGGRLHEGVDIFSPAGTPNVAVVPGLITQKIGSRSGNGVYLFGDDGNSYWYFHLSSFEGSPRRVTQGEVIGYTGDTGNAAPGSYHTHWEYHPGHGAPVNPYPIAAAACF